jgi:subtilase family serine protease
MPPSTFGDGMFIRSKLLRFGIVFIAATTLPGSVFASEPAASAPFDRIAQADRITRVDRVQTAIDDNHPVALRGNTHPLARPVFSTGRLAPATRMEKMILVLQSNPRQQSALDAFVRDLNNPTSSQYRQWLTPETFAERFGVSEHDIDRIQSWLTSQGFAVDEIAASHRLIVFSGSAAQVESAFHTEMRTYNIGGRAHIANAFEPSIPAALAGIVSGVSTLHDFRRTPLHTVAKTVSGNEAHYNASPEFTVGAQHFLAPADFATIYDIGPLHSSSIDGTGQTVAVVGRSNIKATDVSSFRAMAGLPANPAIVTVVGTDPGTVNSEDELEADLDVEWAGAVAKNATINLVAAASTATTDGIDLAAQYVVNNNIAPVMSISFGSCEASMGAAERAFYNDLFQQAAAQGITTLVASGDGGSAGCDAASSAVASHGRAVNGLCSTAYDLCVGGTQFEDAPDPSLYWSASSNAATDGSALGYIPEAAWNESAAVAGGRGLYSTGGGMSAFVAKPSWQSGAGVPADGHRDVPDISMTAGSHDGYLVYSEGALEAVGGTSAPTPALAGLMALIAESTSQANGARLGNVNPILYALAGQHPAAFHDITAGNNSVPGAAGYSAVGGYDLATGLGSLDAAQLVSMWPGSTQSPKPSPAISLSTSAASVALVAGGSQTVQLTVVGSNGFNANVLLGASGLPSGMQTTLQPTLVNANGSATVSITTSDALAAGSYPVTITATGGGMTAAVALTVSVAPRPRLALASDSPSMAVRRGGNSQITVTSSAVAGFNAAVSLHLNGVPRGVTATVSSPSINAPGNGSVAISIHAGANAVRGRSNMVLTAVGGGQSQMYLVPLIIF